MPCAAASSSMPRMCATLAIIGCRRRAAKVAIDTWSSWLALVGRLSTLAGWASDLFSHASAAAVTWAIMKPLFRPASAVRNGGRRETPASISIAMRRSAIAPTSAMAQRHRVGGQRHRLGVEVAAGDHRRAVSSAKTSGLSVTALASRSSTSAAWRSWSRQAPTTCGWQRRQYGILHAVVAFEVRAADRAAGEQRAVVLRRRRSAPAGRAARGCADRTGRRCRARRRPSARRRRAPLRAPARTRAARAAPARSRSACR